jgi:hypothetical protein
MILACSVLWSSGARSCGSQGADGVFGTHTVVSSNAPSGAPQRTRKSMSPGHSCRLSTTIKSIPGTACISTRYLNSLSPQPRSSTTAAG